VSATVDGILDWSRGNIREGYGSGPSIMIFADLMQSVEYPGLDLTHVHISGGRDR
jgi:hypothetical protein